MNLPFIVNAALGRLPCASSLPFPAFDPDHADEEILDAFEKIRAHRSWTYRQEALNGGKWPKEYYDATIRLEMEAEANIRDTWATTVAGVAARLMLALPDIAEDRRVDQALMENGIGSVYRSRNRLDDPLRHAQLAQAAFELIEIDWTDARANYDRCVADFACASGIQIALAELEMRQPGLKEELSDLKAAVQANAERAENTQALDRLMMTPVSDAEQMLDKMKIMLAEGRNEDAAPWLARDAATISGWLDGDRTCPAKFEFPAPAAERVEG